MKNSVKIGIVLGGALLVLSGVLFYGARNSAHFEEITLEKSGVVIDSNIETAKFSTGDVLYQMWNDDEMIATSSGDKQQQILTDDMLFFEDDSVLFTKKFTVIDTNGLTDKTKSRISYEFASSGEYTAEDSKIAENSIVKLANRRYFLNATAKVCFDDNKEVATVDRPLLLIDKTGSVIVYDVPTKKRYLGHLSLVIDENKWFDVSDEKYYVDNRVIDLSSFGGTDNQKLVVATSEEKKDKDSLSVKRNYSSEEKSKSANDDESSTITNNEAVSNEEGDTAASENSNNTASTDANSNVSSNQAANNGNTTGNQSTNNAASTGGQTIAGGNQTASGSQTNNNPNVDQAAGNKSSYVTLKDYEKLLEKIKELNKKFEKSIPVLLVNYINPEVTSLSYSYKIVDMDHTLVGSTRVELVNEKTNEIIETAYVNNISDVETFSNLIPNTSYHLRFIYQYDLGEGDGIQELEVVSDSFETASVEAVYQMKDVSSTSMVIKASTDHQMTDLSRARLKVISEDGASFTIDGNADLVGNGGQEFTITGLSPETTYHYQLELSLPSGESFVLGESEKYKTLVGTIMDTFAIDITEDNLIEVSFDWTSAEYDLQDVSVQLSETATEEKLDYNVVDQSEQKLTIVPLTKNNISSFSVELDLAVTDSTDGQQEVLSYDNPTVVTYAKNAALSIYKRTNNSTISGNTALKMNPDLSVNTADAAKSSTSTEEYICSLQWVKPLDTSYTIVTERKEKQQLDIMTTGIKEEVWQVFDTQQVTVEDKKLQLEVPLSELSVSSFDFRQAIYDSDGTLIMYVYPS